MEIHVHEDIVDHITGEIGKAGDLAAIIDGHRRVECLAAEIADVNWISVLPKQRMLGAKFSDGIAANAGNADDLAPVVDGGGGAIRIRRKRRELLNLVLSRAVDDGFELENLRECAGGIVDGVLGPADNLIQIIYARGKTVGTAEGGELGLRSLGLGAYRRRPCDTSAKRIGRWRRRVAGGTARGGFAPPSTAVSAAPRRDAERGGANATASLRQETHRRNRFADEPHRSSRRIRLCASIQRCDSEDVSPHSYTNPGASRAGNQLCQKTNTCFGCVFVHRTTGRGRWRFWRLARRAELRKLRAIHIGERFR